MNRNLDSLSVALCTYNGSKYILEQLNSIAAQKYLPNELVVCDDDSIDDTIAIVERFANSVPFPVRIYRNEIRLGVIHNFEKAVKLCTGNYIALCDQDDIWLPNKLADSMEVLLEVEKGLGKHVPLLVQSDLHVVDKNLNIIHSSFFSMQKIHFTNKNQLKILITQNFVTGCTVVMNRSLAISALPFPKDVLMHDWWFALVASSVGKILLAPQTNILYRQHGSNQVGAKTFYHNIKKIFKPSELDKSLAKTINQTISLRNHLEQYLQIQPPLCLVHYIRSVLRGGFKEVLEILKLGVNRQGISRKCIYYLLLMRGRYIKYINFVR